MGGLAITVGAALLIGGLIGLRNERRRESSLREQTLILDVNDLARHGDCDGARTLANRYRVRVERLQENDTAFTICNAFDAKHRQAALQASSAAARGDCSAARVHATQLEASGVEQLQQSDPAFAVCTAFDDPKHQHAALQTSAAVKRGDCDGARLLAKQLPTDKIGHLQRIDRSFAICMTIDDPAQRRLALDAIGAARRDDCDGVRANVERLDARYSWRLQQIDVVLAKCVESRLGPVAETPPAPDSPPPPPLPATQLGIREPAQRQAALQASSAARRGDCDGARANAKRLERAYVRRLRKIDAAFATCVVEPEPDPVVVPPQPPPEPAPPGAPPPPPPPLPATQIEIADPVQRQAAIQASSAARRGDCLGARVNARRLEPALRERLAKIDAAFAACMK